MSDDQPTPTPTTSGYPWAPPDGATASGPAAPVPYDAGVGHPTPAGAPYSDPSTAAPGPTGYPSLPPTYLHGPGYPPGHGPVAYPGPRPYDGFAIAGFVLSFVGAVVLSVIFGILGLVRTKGGRARGRGLAVASLVISALWFVARFVGVPYDDSRLDFFIVYPQQIGWYTGDRLIACIVTAPEDVTSTLRGAAQ